MNEDLRAMSVETFCARYGVGRTTAYEEIKNGRLRANKIKAHTLILADAAEAWVKSLPPSKPEGQRE